MPRSLCGFSELHAPDVGEVSFQTWFTCIWQCHHVLKFWIDKGRCTLISTDENYQITFKMQIKDTVVSFSLIIHLNTCIHSIAAHQIINLEFEICTSSLNWGGGRAERVSPRGWQGAGFFQITQDCFNLPHLWGVVPPSLSSPRLDFSPCRNSWTAHEAAIDLSHFTAQFI